MKKFYSLMSLAAFALSVSAQDVITEEWEMGQFVEIDGKQYVVGRNLINNGSFSADPSTTDNVYYGWGRAKDGYTDGLGTTPELSYPASQATWNATGGYDDGAYITLSSGCGGASSETAFVGHWSISQNSDYYFGFYLKDYMAHVSSTNYKYAPVVSLAKGVHSDCSKNEDNKLFGDGAQYTTDKFVSSDDWSPVGVIFNNTEYNWLQFRFSWTNPGVGLDGFRLHKLYDATNIDKDDPKSAIAILDYMDALEAISFYVDSELAEYTSIADEAYDYVMFHQDTPLETVEEYEAATAEAKTYLINLQNTLVTISEINAQLEVMALLMNDDNPYPGIDELNEACTIYSDYVDNGLEPLDDSSTAIEYVTVALDNIKKAIEAYRFSQVPSEDNPADYSFFVSNPSFDAQGPWYVGTTPDGAQQQIMTVDGTVCWQSWCNKQNYGSLELYQDLSNLPNGYYTVSVNMTTQGGCITDQHAVAVSSLATANSPVLTDESIDVTGPAGDATGVTWETLTTEKVAVVDGKLKIGAVGHCSDEIVAARGDYRAGSFWITNFKLQYYGPLSDEDALAAYNAKVAEVQAQADTMHFAGDKAAYQAVISENSGVTTVEGIADALAAIAEAQTVAVASENKYAEVVAGTYAALQDSLQNAYGEKVGQIVKKAVDLATAEINAADATYTTMDAMTTKLRYYRDSYVPAFDAAEAVEVVDATAKAAMEGTLADEVKVLTAVDTIPGSAVLDEHIAILNNAIKVCEAADIIAAGGTDYTALITNAAINDERATGWTLRRENSDGNGAKKGQAYDDDANGYYLDSYNSTAGKLLYTAYQTIENIPNGLYELKTMNRVSGTPGAEGVYTYAIADNDTVNAVFKAIHQERMNITELGGPAAEDGGDSIAYVSDSYGSIFAKAWKDTNGGADVEPGTVEEGILGANNGHGRGWFYNTLQIEVKNHVLTIGVTNDSVFTKGHKDTDGNDCVPFSGWWFSCDNFTLTQVSAGDNEGWNPATGIEGVEDGEDADIVVRVENGTIVSNGVIYSISGARVANGSKVPAGVYVVRLGNTAKKVLVK
ncbi:MAG: hypothetical protein J6C86_07700 [Bacteroidaceae bacterium]|nr:hypothetical protein [Bacteroidaceae bacterium]